MRKAFTLIELLVVMVIMTVIMGMVVPQGSKLLDSFQTRLKVTKEKQELSKQKSVSFLQAKEQEVEALGAIYKISNKGVLTKREKSNDNN